MAPQGNSYIMKDLTTYIDNIKALANDKSDKRVALSANQYLLNRIYGNKICEEISNALGIRNRGVKDGSGLYIPKYTPMPCVLIECSFVDSQNDMDKYSGEKMPML